LNATQANIGRLVLKQTEKAIGTATTKDPDQLAPPTSLQGNIMPSKRQTPPISPAKIQPLGETDASSVAGVIILQNNFNSFMASDL
jgi:hypothetical protein